jgi:hypothetical protein
MVASIRATGSDGSANAIPTEPSIQLLAESYTDTRAPL